MVSPGTHQRPQDLNYRSCRSPNLFSASFPAFDLSNIPHLPTISHPTHRAIVFSRDIDLLKHSWIERVHVFFSRGVLTPLFVLLSLLCPQKSNLVRVWDVKNQVHTFTFSSIKEMTVAELVTYLLSQPTWSGATDMLCFEHEVGKDKGSYKMLNTSLILPICAHLKCSPPLFAHFRVSTLYCLCLPISNIIRIPS